MSITGVLQNWYERICKSSIGTGIQIETVADYGWYVSIDLFDTVYENEPFDSVNIKKDDSCWFKCNKENSIFKGYGGIRNLEDILNVFCSWVKI
jgi:hypothetical protein